MFTRISDFDRTLTIMNELQQRMNQIFREVEPNRVSPTTHRLNRQSWPLINLYDHSQEFILQAFVPGFSEKEIKISGQQDVLTLSGDRNQNAPENGTPDPQNPRSRLSRVSMRSIRLHNFHGDA